MKLREIIKLSAIMLSIDDVLNGDKIYDETFDITDEKSIIADGSIEERNLNLLIRCFNLAYNELATDYFSLLHCEKIVVKNGSFNLNLLNQNFHKIVKLSCNEEVCEKFEIYDNILYVKDGEYNIVYSFIPEFATLNTEINNFNGSVTERILVYGLNKEYCFISGLYSEAESYKIKYEEAIKQALSFKRNINLPKRRWL